MKALLGEIAQCKACAVFLPHGPRPVVVAGKASRIVIIGQAPGRKVHACGVPWWDASGNTLRAWLGVDTETFYNPAFFALMPMGFCYPGTGTSGDLPPRPECAPRWHPRLLEEMKSVKLILLVGQYSQRHYLGRRAERNLAETVRNFREYSPQFLPLPHPSPRNRLWLRRNAWFEHELLPVLKTKIAGILQ